MGPCLCGDTHCSSCGPAQGNWRCPLCRTWADDGCEHINEEGTDLRPECQEAARLQAEAEAQAEREYDPLWDDPYWDGHTSYEG